MVDKNRLVALHRDEFIPVKDRIRAAEWDLWSLKEGTHFVRPPRFVLEELVGVRVAVDVNDSQNGPLETVPGSHIQGGSGADRVSSHIGVGGRWC